MSIAIEKSIPLPEQRKRRSYPYQEMDVGDSFFVDQIKPQIMFNRNLEVSKKTGMKFTARREGNGVRVWRIE